MQKSSEKKLSRRQILKGGALAGAGLLVPWSNRMSKAVAGSKQTVGIALSGIPQSPDDRLTFFDDSKFYTAPLIAPLPVAKPVSRVPGIFAYYQMEMKEGSFTFNTSLGLPTPTWGYDDTKVGYIGYLGPIIETRKFEQVAVKWVNKLPTAVDGPFGLADPFLIPGNLPGGRAVVHIHGMHTLSKYDGGPENWFSPGQDRTYYYPNIQDAASLWYHDHAVGVTRLNAYVGLASLYILRDSVEDKLNLPKGPYEIPLVLQDKAFYKDGSFLKLWYPNPWQPESFGNVIMVNAQLWPVLEVEPRKYRFRLYNAANARVFRLRIADVPGGTNSVLPFHQIGAEGGLLPNSAQLNTLVLANGERADLIIDFKGKENGEFYLTNDAATPFDPGQPPLDPSTDFDVMQVMKFKVKATGGTDKTISLPARLAPITPLKPASATVKRQIALVEAPDTNHPDPEGDPTATGPFADWAKYYKKVLLNNRLFMPGDGAFDETPKLGATEIWQFINLTPDTHPMHMHLVTFQVIGRQKLAPADLMPSDPNTPVYLTYKYGADGNGGQVASTGAVADKYLLPGTEAPAPNETGFKDTVKANPGEVTYVIAKFEHFTGKFVYHCHILDHEENDMMQYMRVVGPLGKEGEDEGFVEHSVMPENYALDQNFPNPFNPETTIRFQIPEGSHVTIRIFNTAGQEVASLVNSELPAGWHTASWNASNLPSGAYFYRLETGSFAAVKKMLLLK